MNDWYIGREQTEAKHQILRRYLESFAHKVVRTYGSLDYIDAFCGPWESRCEDFGDTSFSIALTILNDVASTISDGNNSGIIRCIFNEKNRGAYRKLAAFVDQARPKYPLLEIHATQGAFEDNVLEIKELCTHKFKLLFVDPTGWSGFSPLALQELAGHRESEIIINFMQSFILRFLSPESPEQKIRLAELLGVDRARRVAGRYVPIDEIEHELHEVLREDLGFRFVGSSPIHNPDRNEIHFQLVYGTNHPAGMEVMRKAEFKALSKHDQNRFMKKQDTFQGDLFGGTLQVEGPYLRQRRDHIEALTDAIRSRMTRSSSNLKFSTLRADVQQRLFVVETEVKDAVVELAAKEEIRPTWEERNARRPGPDDRMIPGVAFNRR